MRCISYYVAAERRAFSMLIVIVFVIALSISCGRKTEDPTLVTKVRIRNSYATLMWRSKEEPYLWFFIEERFKKGADHGKLVSTIVSNPHIELSRIEEINDWPVIRDGWGRPIQVTVSTNSIGGDVRAAISWDQLGLSIWSFGKNGLDDNGLGDDIVLSRQELTELMNKIGK